jgi:hypothetical protein
MKSKNRLGWRHDSSGTVLDWPAQGPEFKPLYCLKEKDKGMHKEFSILMTPIFKNEDCDIMLQSERTHNVMFYIYKMQW